MIKTILVAASGGEGDRSVFETALALARPLAAHLDFYHLWVSPDESAALAPHVDFAQGRALTEALEGLQRDATAKSASSVRLFQEFCQANDIPIIDPGDAAERVSASWLEEKDGAIRRLIVRARHHDLVVVGHPHMHGTRRNVAGQLIMASGRPILIAPPVAKAEVGAAVMVGWKETPEAARALSAAMPILKYARRVILASVEDGAPPAAARDLAGQLAWHGIRAETRLVPADGRSVAERLLAAALTARADLLVAGAYGHSRIRELIFGGVTEALLDGADLPILLAH
ncbi:MAG TPA: universal stress protein [Roseiarcus sp.]|nr:universal stress protein [Roseiarcus sp.]